MNGYHFHFQLTPVVYILVMYLLPMTWFPSLYWLRLCSGDSLLGGLFVLAGCRYVLVIQGVVSASWMFLVTV